MLIIEIIHQAKKKNLCVISLVLCDSLNLCNFIDDIYTYIYIYIYIFFFCGETIDDFFGSNICV